MTISVTMTGWGRLAGVLAGFLTRILGDQAVARVDGPRLSNSALRERLLAAGPEGADDRGKDSLEFSR